MNKCRALTDKNLIRDVEYKTKLIKIENVCRACKELHKSLNLGPLIRNSFGVKNKNNYNSNWKNLLGFRNMLEKLEMKFKFWGGQIPLMELVKNIPS